MTELATSFRTHTCGELRRKHIGQKVRLCGWVRRKRQLGDLIFIDLWDRYGITQLLFNPQLNPEAFQQVQQVDREYVLQVEGVVRERENKNPRIPTGEIEILVEKVWILNSSAIPPFVLEEHTDGGEDIRARFRYLDMRRPYLQRNLLFRHHLLQEVRRWLSEKGFVEIETPFLVRSTPEGARDFLVPSRQEPGKFYALPQSPQLFKQIFMIAGFDRYFQIVRCFRDEDLRADRQPEFTQIDCELSFVEERDVLEIFEEFVHHLFRTLLDVSLPPFHRISYQEALHTWGTDAPDLRIPARLLSCTHTLQGYGFRILDQAKQIGAILLKELSEESRSRLTRKFWNTLEEEVRETPGIQFPGFFYLFWESSADEQEFRGKGPLPSLYPPELLRSVFVQAGGKPGDVLIVVANTSPSSSANSEDDEEFWFRLGRFRTLLGKKLYSERLSSTHFVPLFVTPFPLFSWNAEESRWESQHHPFTAPYPDDEELLDTDPSRVRARAYDLVINGVEIAGGSIRIHRADLQRKILRLLGYSDREMEERFGFFLQALEYGAPPHGGIAFGFDRLCALMVGAETIRDVIAFPKNKAGRDVMMDAPAPVSSEQLQELHIQIVDPGHHEEHI